MPRLQSRFSAHPYLVGPLELGLPICAMFNGTLATCTSVVTDVYSSCCAPHHKASLCEYCRARSSAFPKEGHQTSGACSKLCCNLLLDGWLAANHSWQHVGFVLCFFLISNFVHVDLMLVSLDHKLVDITAHALKNSYASCVWFSKCFLGCACLILSFVTHRSKVHHFTGMLSAFLPASLNPYLMLAGLLKGEQLILKGFVFSCDVE